jgi:hypothetical protein
MEKEDREPTAEEPIVVNLIKDKKQMRVTIPAYIVENFHISPDRHRFGWYIQEKGKDEQGKDIVIILGKFLIKRKNGKED